MTKAIRHLAGPDNGTVGDMIDNTDRHLIYKVMLEDRIFRTWHGGRTVLIGDACHKSVPFTGKGASESMLDAVVLASLLYDMPSDPSDPSTPSFKNYFKLQQAFQQYYNTRAYAAKQSVDTSSGFGALLVKDGWTGHFVRKVVFGLNAGWIGRKKLDMINFHRIQASFLPQVPDRGLVSCRPHVRSRRPIIGASSFNNDKEYEEEDYGDDNSTIGTDGRDGSTSGGGSAGVGGGTRSVGGSNSGRLRASGEDKVLDHAIVDEFLTGVRQPSPVFIS
ncbi:hypothetical protein BGX26_003509 [Mortierella sp. AD094]|nr:hypothetical protein BGX26_003509 [Mortierella sp. AD094]